MIFFIGNVPYPKYLYTTSQDFRSTFGGGIVLFLVRLSAMLWCGWRVAHFQVVAQFTVRYVSCEGAKLSAIN